MTALPLGAIELRNQLQVASGVLLPSTVVFDHPTARQLAVLFDPRGAVPVGKIDSMVDPDQEGAESSTERAHEVLDGAIPVRRVMMLHGRAANSRLMTMLLQNTGWLGTCGIEFVCIDGLQPVQPLPQVIRVAILLDALASSKHAPVIPEPCGLSPLPGNVLTPSAASLRRRGFIRNSARVILLDACTCVLVVDL